MMMVSMYRRLGRISIEIGREVISIFMWGHYEVSRFRLIEKTISDI
jgi:hypothetical protein